MRVKNLSHKQEYQLLHKYFQLKVRILSYRHNIFIQLHSWQNNFTISLKVNLVISRNYDIQCKIYLKQMNHFNEFLS